MALLKIEVVDRAGVPLQGVAVAASGAAEVLVTNAMGMVQFLLDDAPQVSFSIDRIPAYQAAAADTPRQLRMQSDGAGGFVRVH